MARRNVIAALVLIVLAIVYGILTDGLPNRSLPNTPGPSFFPWLIAGGLLVLAVALLVQGLKKPGDTADTAGNVMGGRQAAALAWYALYLAALPHAGFISAGIPFFAGLMVLYGARRPHWIALGSIAAPVSLFLLFRHLFLIPMPRGPLSALLT